MAKQDSNIVGWITRGGKKIPIRKGESGNKPGWKKYDEKRDSDNVKSGKGYSDDVKKEARRFADEINATMKRGNRKAAGRGQRRQDEYAKKQGIDSTEFSKYVSGLGNQRKRVVHKRGK